MLHALAPERIRFQHLGFFVLRRPLNSIERLSKFHQRLGLSGFEKELKEEFSSPFLQEGIRLASDELYESLMRWLRGEVLSGHHELVRTFYKYFIRSSTRCTPFGLFAGLAYGEISDATIFECKPDVRPWLKVVPDFTWQRQMTDRLFGDVSIRSCLLIKANSSLVSIGGSYRYIERVREEYYLSTFGEDDTLRTVLSLAGKEIRYSQLADKLVEMGHSRDEVVRFIDDLLTNDLLEFVKQPTVIGRAFPGRIIEDLPNTETLQDSAGWLQDIQALCTVEDSDLNRLAILRDRMMRMDGMHTPDRRLKVDAFFTFESAKLSEGFVQSTIDSLNDLSVLNFSYEHQELKSFKETFHLKYDTQEVPLWLALDSQLGIGFKGDLSSLDAIGDGPTARRRSDAPNVIDPATMWWQSYLVSKYLQIVAVRNREIVLSNEDLAEIRNLRPGNLTTTLAKSAFAFGSILETEGAEDGHRNLQFVLSACQGPSAINMLGRFADGCSKIRDQVSKIVAYEQEQRPDLILAELVHSPGTKVANVMSRPTLYDYEIEYLGNSSVTEENVIRISDLMVSVREGQIILRSKRLNKRVIPRLSNMHNHQHGLPVYRFLAALQSQDSSFNIGWDWGLLSNSDFLPRVRYQHVIVSRATWKIHRSDFEALTIHEVPEKLALLEIPEQFVLVVGDNELFIDVAVSMSVELFREHVSKNKVSIIREFMPGQGKSILTVANEPVNNEVVIPFLISAGAQRQLTNLSCSGSSQVIEQFEPGSEWVYFKIYASEGMLDLLIRDKISQFVGQLMEDQVVEKFFFVRYRDSESHLRLRFLRRAGSTLDDIVAGIRRLLAFELAHKLVSKIQLDTYQRELDRYGREKIELCEAYFSEDSLAILQFLKSGKTVKSVHERLGYAVANVKKLLELTGNGSTDLSALCMHARNRLLTELSVPLMELSKWRQFTKELVQQNLFLNQQQFYCGNTGTLDEIFEGPGAIEHRDLALSLIHMSVNRLFKDNQRYYEAIVFHIVHKILLAKTKYVMPLAD